MKTYNITLKHEPIFWLGDRFYKIEEPGKYYSKNGRAEFTSKCPSCNGTRQITYKGYNGKEFECECPICKTNNLHTYGDRLTLINWTLHEYIVYSIEAHGPETLSAYKNGECCLNSLSLNAFCKTGRCMDDYIQTNVPLMSRNIDKDIDTIDMASSFFNPKDYVFKKKADAMKFYNILKERDRKRLEEFNKTYETEYEYPF